MKSWWQRGTLAIGVIDLLVASSQQSLEEDLTIPSETDAGIIKGISRFAPRIIPEFRLDQSDFPSWFDDRARFKAIQEVAWGGAFGRNFYLWLRQERKLAFGLNETIVS